MRPRDEAEGTFEMEQREDLHSIRINFSFHHSYQAFHNKRAARLLKHQTQIITHCRPRIYRVPVISAYAADFQHSKIGMRQGNVSAQPLTHPITTEFVGS
jgi:hypothetical protein